MQWLLKSPALPLFTQPFIQAQIAENIKGPRHWTGDFPAQMTIKEENDSIGWRHHDTDKNAVGALKGLFRYGLP